jgi:hypothetical protein
VSGCPRCGADVASGQEFCLECGARLPGPGAVGRARDAGRGWIVRALIALGVASAAAALAVATSEGREGSTEVLTATGGFASPPATNTLPAPLDSIAEWPPGEEGWTIALATLPQTEGRNPAVLRARRARSRGLTSVGILDSSQYASLHPGSWIVFAGVYASEAEATSMLQQARRFARTATVRHVVP